MCERVNKILEMSFMDPYSVYWGLNSKMYISGSNLLKREYTYLHVNP